MTCCAGAVAYLLDSVHDCAIEVYKARNSGCDVQSCCSGGSTINFGYLEEKGGWVDGVWNSVDSTNPWNVVVFRQWWQFPLHRTCVSASCPSMTRGVDPIQAQGLSLTLNWLTDNIGTRPVSTHAQELLLLPSNAHNKPLKIKSIPVVCCTVASLSKSCGPILVPMPQKVNAREIIDL
jgi:hypothetical protein